MTPRRLTRQIRVGDDRTGVVRIGGDAAVSVQTMTAGYTHEIDKCVAEINKLAAAGADIVRVAVPERKDTDALKEFVIKVVPDSAETQCARDRILARRIVFPGYPKRDQTTRAKPKLNIRKHLASTGPAKRRLSGSGHR